MFIVTGLSITGGYHRCFSHNSYKAHRSLQVIYACFGAAAFQNSILEWANDHRNHHRYSETEKDPYNITQGFWHAHLFWLLFQDPKEDDFSNCDDLMNNPVVTFQHKHINLLSTFFGIVLPTLIAALWGDPIGGFLIAGALRIFVLHHATFSINSVCHTFGKANYTDQTAKDNWVTSLFTLGEGFHNYLHKFPADYRNGIRWFHFDPTKWLIKILSWLKITTELNATNHSLILKYNLRHLQKNMNKAGTQNSSIIESSTQKIKFIKKIEHKLEQYKSTKKHYKQRTALRALFKKKIRQFKQYRKILSLS